MKLGSLASNPNKIRLMEILLKGESEKEEIAKKMRLPPKTVETILSELVSEGFVKISESGYKITEEGERALKSLKEDAGGKRR